MMLEVVIGEMADEVTNMEVDKVTDMKIIIEDFTDSGDWWYLLRWCWLLEVVDKLADM